MKKLLAVVLILTMLLSFASCRKRTEVSKFPTMTYIYNTSDAHKAIAEYVQSALGAHGINLRLENQEWNTFLDTRKAGDYTIARNGWVADYSDPICFLDMWTSYAGNNDVQFGKGNHAGIRMYNLDLTPYGYDINVANGTWAETYDVLIATIKSCTNHETRYALMHLAEDMVMATGCITPLYYYTDLYLIEDSVKGFYSNPLGYKYFMNTTIAGKNTLDVCIGSEPDSLDPAINSTVDGATMLIHLFSGLARWEMDAEGKLVIAPDCAESLPKGVQNADGTVTYTYTLKKGLKWSNGETLKASDFVYAWNRAASASLGSDYGYMFDLIVGYDEVAKGIDGAKLAAVANDEARTITVTITNAAAYWNELLAFPTYFPVHRAAVANENWATSVDTYVGNGPYIMSSWTHDSNIVLSKNANYHGATTMDTIVCHLSDNENTMLTNFKNGAWHLIDAIPTAEIATLKAQYPTAFRTEGRIGTYYISWNINARILPADSTLTGVEAELAQQEIRRAIALLLDRNYIVDVVSQGGEVPASSFVAMGMTNPDGSPFYKTANSMTDGFDGYFDVGEAAFEGNVAKAVEILKKYYR